MKKLISAIATMMIITNTFAAEQSMLTSFKVAEGSSLERLDVNAGVVSVDEKEVTLHVYHRCQPNERCPRIYRGHDVILPIVSRIPSFCGSKIIARKDARPVDGNLQEIVLTDYRFATCEMVIVNPTVVQYTQSFVDRTAPQAVTFVHTFAGEELLDVQE